MSAPMVRALLAGTKTQTRRKMKEQPLPGRVIVNYDGSWDDVTPARKLPGMMTTPMVAHRTHHCPYGVPGDRLLVRETWGYRCTEGTKVPGEYMHTIKYRADDSRQTFGPMPIDGVGLPKQRARGACEMEDQRQEYMTRYWKQWRPAIFMPRWASRITLEITEVRVERLCEISEADAIAEGIGRYDNGTFGLNDPGACMGTTAVVAYMRLWESINGPGSWDLNPWVWALTFRRTGDA